MQLKSIYHLYSRIGFGINTKQALQKQQLSINEVVENELKNAQHPKPLPSIVSKEELKEILTIRKELMVKKDKKKALKLFLKGTKLMHQYNWFFIDYLGKSNQNLLDKMTLFWLNHFVCKDKNILHFEGFVNTIRKHALGNFSDFILAIAKTPSMIKYLNNKQNKKRSPNENFARELMELFTLGRDNYTQKDIKEAARAFTGWTHNFNGFRFNSRQHDYEEKEFLGEKGNFDGDDIVQIILKQKQTARFICEKIYRYFVNDNINNEHVSQMEKVFYKDYNIHNLMQFVLTANWFYHSSNVGVKIKSPIELLVGYNKVIPFKFTKPKQLSYLQKLLGQLLFFPPNVAGWKTGRNWINANSLILRLKLASVILSDGIINLDEKDSFEVNFRQKLQANRKRIIQTEVNWNSFNENYQSFKLSDLKKSLIQVPISAETQNYLDQLDTSDIKNYCIQLMSIPEYQLC